jgi:hypothetical protein
MVSELRYMIFTSADLAEALDRPEFLDMASQDLRVVRMDEDCVEFALLFGDDEAPENLTLDTALLLRAMIRYCVKEGIPIPRHAAKSLELVNGGLVLQIHSDPRIRSEHEREYYTVFKRKDPSVKAGLG